MHAKELLDDPIDDDEIAAALLQLAAQLLKKSKAKTNGNPDRLLSLPDAAAKINVSNSWLYHHAKKLPFTVRNGRRLSFSEQGIEQYIQKKQNKNT